MATHKMKVNFNRVIEMIYNVLEHSAYAKKNGLDFAIDTGLKMIRAYMVEIAEYAIEKKDERLIELLFGMCLLVEDTKDA